MGLPFVEDSRASRYVAGGRGSTARHRRQAWAKAGATAFEDGDTIRLVNAAPSLESTGDVRVSTTDTSVTFTVVSDEYFDGPGSTITFRAEERQGMIYFEQQANAYDANVFVFQSAWTLEQR